MKSNTRPWNRTRSQHTTIWLSEKRKASFAVRTLVRSAQTSTTPQVDTGSHANWAELEPLHVASQSSTACCKPRRVGAHRRHETADLQTPLVASNSRRLSIPLCLKHRSTLPQACATASLLCEGGSRVPTPQLRSVAGHLAGPCTGLQGPAIRSTGSRRLVLQPHSEQLSPIRERCGMIPVAQAARHACRIHIRKQHSFSPFIGAVVLANSLLPESVPLRACTICNLQECS